MARKKAVNWAVIKKRYLSGESPKSIAEDYGIEPKAITNKAYREEWGRQREIIQDNIIASVENDLKDLVSVTIAVHREFMHNLKGQAKEITNPYLFDGERTNSLFQTAMNNAVKLTQAVLKSQQDNSESDDEPPGFNVNNAGH